MATAAEWRGEATRTEEVTASRLELQAMCDLVNNPRQLERLAEEGATDEDLADIFGVPVERLQEQLGPVLRKARANLRLRVRRALLKAGDDGDSQVLGYLAVQHLHDGGVTTASANLSAEREAKRLAAGARSATDA